MTLSPNHVNHTRWDGVFDEAVESVRRRDLGRAVSTIHRLRRWQHRQANYGLVNIVWHDAELSWLEGLALTRARRFKDADAVWARLTQTILRDGYSFSQSMLQVLPCDVCAQRRFDFGPTWDHVAVAIAELPRDSEVLKTALAAHARKGTLD